MDHLRDRVAVITGAGSGIGRAMAQACAAEGMRLALLDLKRDALEQTAMSPTKRRLSSPPPRSTSVWVLPTCCSTTPACSPAGRCGPHRHASGDGVSRST